MPRDKDLKRLIRARMDKTGESYTTARAHILRKQSREKTADPIMTAAAAGPSATAADALAAPAGDDDGGTGTGAVSEPPDLAAIAGVSDAAVERSTGRAWAAWVELLDAAGAAALPHAEIAALIHGTYDVDGWWAQSVTVGYERIRGLRDRGQRRDGAYEAAKSKTFGVDVATLFDACADDTRRRRWLGDVALRVRTATVPRSMRLDWPDGTRVAFWFTAKGDAKSSLSVQHEKLPDRAAVDQMKQFWTERLAALADLLQT